MESKTFYIYKVKSSNFKLKKIKDRFLKILLKNVAVLYNKPSEFIFGF